MGEYFRQSVIHYAEQIAQRNHFVFSLPQVDVEAIRDHCAWNK